MFSIGIESHHTFFSPSDFSHSSSLKPLPSFPSITLIISVFCNRYIHVSVHICMCEYVCVLTNLYKYNLLTLFLLFVCIWFQGWWLCIRKSILCNRRILFLQVVTSFNVDPFFSFWNPTKFSHLTSMKSCIWPENLFPEVSLSRFQTILFKLPREWSNEALISSYNIFETWQWPSWQSMQYQKLALVCQWSDAPTAAGF